MKKVFDRIASYLAQSPTRFFFVAAIAAFFVLWYVNEYLDPSGFKWHDVIVESHGVLFDLLVFGILLSIYEALREKKDKIERLHEEIDDYRNWDEKEASYRIVGAIKRLNKLKITKIDLSQCFLENTNLEGVNLENSNLHRVKLKKANLEGIILNGCTTQGEVKKVNLTTMAYNFGLFCTADFEEVKMEGATIKNATLMHINLKNIYAKKVDLSGTNLKGANLKNTELILSTMKKVTLSKCNLEDSRFSGTDLSGSDFSGATMKQTSFHGANLEGATFTNVKFYRDFFIDVVSMIDMLVDVDFFQKLEKGEVYGREAIIEKYYIDQNNRLQLKENQTG